MDGNGLDDLSKLDYKKATQLKKIVFSRGMSAWHGLEELNNTIDKIGTIASLYLNDYRLFSLDNIETGSKASTEIEKKLKKLEISKKWEEIKELQCYYGENPKYGKFALTALLKMSPNLEKLHYYDSDANARRTISKDEIKKLSTQLTY